MVIVRLILISMLFSLATSCSTSIEVNKKSDAIDTTINSTSPTKTIIEANSHKEFDSIPKNQISNPKFPLEELFGIWTTDPDGPHADFRLDSNSFYIVDYEGNGDMPYILKEDSLIIFFNEFTSKNKILKVDKDSLILESEDGITRNVRWKD